METVIILIRKDVANSLSRSVLIHNRVVTESQHLPSLEGLKCSLTNPELKAYNQSQWEQMSDTTKADLIKNYWYAELHTIFERNLQLN